MKKILLPAALLAAAAVAAPFAKADDRRDGDHRDHDKLTVAVFGDWPYAQLLLDNAKLLINSVNSDPDVEWVIHVGDIHSGSMACTSAGILPPISTSVPDWNQKIYFQFQQFKEPLVYTPGDNEWTDCHKTKEFKSGQPLKELAAVRSLFFARPGHTLGVEDKEVWTQAEHFDPSFPSDAQFVENVMWEDTDVVFVTLNIPGSNNDTLPWTNGFEDLTGHANEIAQRNAANIRWLDKAFAFAEHDHAKGVVVAIQADMFDPAALVAGGDGLDAYTPFVQELANRSVHFGKPVLLLNGDSHLFEADQPLANPASATGQIHHTQPVPNLTRITVQGSTNAPAEWLRLTIDPRSKSVFSWENVSYCKDPLTSCQ
jgi:hypothetical protein